MIRIETFLVIVITFFSTHILKAQHVNVDNVSEKPNIIFIVTDDHRFDAMGAMGNSIIQTPHMDKLVQGGILFQNAYVTTSICCVSRASMLTGQYQSRHNINDFKTNLSEEAFAKTYPALLKGAGYNVGFIGKFGVGDNPPRSQYDFWFDTGTRGQPHYLMTDAHGNKIHDTDTISHSIQKFLSDFGNRGPFCLSVSFKAPHEQDGNPPTYIIQERYKDYYADVNIPYPVTADEKYWNQFPDFFRTESNFARSRWKGLFGTPELYQENVKNYYRLITGVDDAIGKMIKTLEQTGIAKNTIIIVMGDNGMFLGEHGMEGKWYGYEESIRVPLIIYNPQATDKIKNYKAEQIALNIDVAPTILAMAGVKIPGEMQGLNLLDVVQTSKTEREDFFYQHYFLGSPNIPQVEGVVTRKFKYMNYIEYGYEELFDITLDPHETNNLAGDPKYSSKLNQLRKRYKELKKGSF